MSSPTGGDGNRRPTKAEKKEEARLEREQIQRKMAARKRNRNLGFIAIAVAVVAVVVAVVIVQPGGEDTPSGAFPTPQQLLDQAAAATTSAGCDDVQTVGFYDGVDDPESPDYTDQAHIGNDERFPEIPALTTYPSIPPTSGPHANIPPGPLPAGVYDDPPDLARAIHSLEHGATVIWYSPSATGEQLDQLKGFYEQTLDDAALERVIVAPYDYEGEGGQLPSGVMMAPTAWHRLQSCAQVNLAVAFDFSSQFSAPPAEGREYAGEAPEAGAGL
ncbi:MAG TPA: DUF3105 domain-containing protein [Actinomycetota bacterium]